MSNWSEFLQSEINIVTITVVLTPDQPIGYDFEQITTKVRNSNSFTYCKGFDEPTTAKKKRKVDFARYMAFQVHKGNDFGFWKDTGKIRKTNVKLFKNGSVQVTGLKAIEEIETIANIVRHLSGLAVVFSSRISTLNSFIKLNEKLDKQQVSEQLRADENLAVSYDPNIGSSIHISSPLLKGIILIAATGTVSFTGYKSFQDVFVDAQFIITKIAHQHQNNAEKNQ